MSEEYLIVKKYGNIVRIFIKYDVDIQLKNIRNIENEINKLIQYLDKSNIKYDLNVDFYDIKICINDFKYKNNKEFSNQLGFSIFYNIRSNKKTYINIHTWNLKSDKIKTIFEYKFDKRIVQVFIRNINYCYIDVVYCDNFVKLLGIINEINKIEIVFNVYFDSIIVYIY